MTRYWLQPSYSPWNISCCITFTRLLGRSAVRMWSHVSVITLDPDDGDRVSLRNVAKGTPQWHSCSPEETSLWNDAMNAWNHTLGDRAIQYRFPVGARDFSVVHTVPYRFWGPPNPLSNEQRGFYSQKYSGRDVKLTTHLHLVRQGLNNKRVPVLN
jgi:hypothetical protein